MKFLSTSPVRGSESDGESGGGGRRHPHATGSAARRMRDEREREEREIDELLGQNQQPGAYQRPAPALSGLPIEERKRIMRAADDAITQVSLPMLGDPGRAFDLKLTEPEIRTIGFLIGHFEGACASAEILGKVSPNPISESMVKAKAHYLPTAKEVEAKIRATIGDAEFYR